MVFLSLAVCLAQKHTVTVNVIPAFAATLDNHPLDYPNPSGAPFEYEVGEEVKLHALYYDKDAENFYEFMHGYAFDKWMEGDKVIGTDPYLTFTMPDHDVVITLVLKVDPRSPGNPESRERTLTLISDNPNGADVNLRHVADSKYVAEPRIVYRMQQGSEIIIDISREYGYQFKGWYDESGNLFSNQQKIEMTMPDRDMTLTAHVELDPTSPENPGANGWNPDTGELFFDDSGTSGRLWLELQQYIYNNGITDQLKSVAICGPMNYESRLLTFSDYYYKNVEVFDFSRFSGGTSLSIRLQHLANLQEIKLPAGIDSISVETYQCAFNRIICHAIVPPYIHTEKYQSEPTFSDVSEDAILYVPALCIEAYRASEWGKFFSTILPITDDVVTLTVNLPAEASDGRYKNNQIELRNRKNGMSMKYVITDDMNYVFANIIKQTEYDIFLKNGRGDILAVISDIKIENEDFTTTFAYLPAMRNVSLKVMAGGKDVSSDCQVTWFDANGSFLSQGSTLIGQPVKAYGKEENTKVKYVVMLSKELSESYLTPDTTTYTVIEGGNYLSLVLSPIAKTTLKGMVKSASEGRAVTNAYVSVTQTSGAGTEKTFTTLTDMNGEFSIAGVYNAPAKVAVVAEDYAILNTDLSMEEVQKPCSFVLNEARGTAICLDIAYTMATSETETPMTLTFGIDDEDLDFELYDKTTGKTITEFVGRQAKYYGEGSYVLTLTEKLNAGDVVSVTMKSKSNLFEPATVICTIDEDDKAKAEVAVKEYGSIHVTFGSTRNKDVIAYLYQDGKLIATEMFYYGNVTFKSLPEDNLSGYTVVTMGKTGNTIAYNALEDLKKNAFYPYTINTGISVKDGVIVPLYIEEVPLVDDKDLYTTEKSYVKINKMEGSAGDYFTVTAKPDFKAEIPLEKRVSLVFDLPEDVSVVSGSVLVGNSTSQYVVDGRKLIVDYPESAFEKTALDAVKFCLMPETGGDFWVATSLNFGRTQRLTIPFGGVHFSVSDLKMNMPEMVADTIFAVNGRTLANSVVEIYDGETKIGQTKASGNGFWTVKADLGSARNLSVHSIMAKVKTPTGIELRSETRSLTYNISAIQVAKIALLYWNPEQQKNYKVEWDMLNPRETTDKYIYYLGNHHFTFTINFTKNDSTIIHDVGIGVKTSSGRIYPLEAKFDGRRKCWVAEGDFGDSFGYDIPVGASVDYSYLPKMIVDRRDLDEAFAELQRNTKEVAAINAEIDRIAEKIANDNTLTSEQVNSLLEEMDRLGASIDPSSGEGDDEDYSDYTMEELEAILAKTDAMYDRSIFLDAYDELFGKNANSFDNIPEGTGSKISMESNAGVSVDKLIADGYEKLEMTDGSDVYVKNTDGIRSVADLSSGLTLTSEMLQTYANLARRFLAATDKPTTNDKDIINCLNEFNDSLSSTMEVCSDISSKAEKALEVLNGAKNSLELDSKAAKELARKAKNAGSDYVKMKNIGRLAENKKIGSVIGKICKVLEQLKVGKILNIYSTYNDIRQGIATVQRGHKQWKAIPNPCKEDWNGGYELGKSAIALTLYGGGYYMAKVSKDMTELFEIGGSVALAPKTFGLSLLWLVKVISVEYVLDKVDDAFVESFNEWVADIAGKRKKLKCKKGSNYPTHPSTEPDSDPEIDPSGFVYEAVPSNRVEGVMASIYYKETKEDMYGDKTEYPVLWNAEEYSQQNPLFTDADGNYRWDVPTGLWQVKFEKEGYETTSTDWLPVPPPQLEVNVGITQNKQPEVKSAAAYEEGVELQFSKYMLPASLTAENISLKAVKGGKETAISAFNTNLLNAENKLGKDDVTYASKVMLVPDGMSLADYDEVRIIVNTPVKSYANLPMRDAYTQTLKIQKKIRSIEVEDRYTVLDESSSAITISVLPAEASKGKTLVVNSGCDEILSVSAKELTLDEKGRASVLLTGEMVGRTGITFSVFDSGNEKTALISATSLVDVVSETENAPMSPYASHSSGYEFEGEGKVTLSCNTPNVTIYYTLDGSCPCESATRKEYTGEPIIISQSCILKVMSVSPSGIESEIAEYSYIVKTADAIIVPVTSDGSSSIYDVQGRKHLTPVKGVNITEGRKVVVK